MEELRLSVAVAKFNQGTITCRCECIVARIHPSLRLCLMPQKSQVLRSISHSVKLCEDGFLHVSADQVRDETKVR
jgi:hypothetical protein